MSKNKYMTSTMIAQELGLSCSHIRRLILTGKIKAEKLGHDWLISPLEFLRFKRTREKMGEKQHGKCE